MGTDGLGEVGRGWGETLRPTNRSQGMLEGHGGAGDSGYPGCEDHIPARMGLRQGRELSHGWTHHPSKRRSSSQPEDQNSSPD